MKKTLRTPALCLLLCCLLALSARAMENDMLKVGIKYGSDAMFSANLQNYDETQAVGYAMGYFDSARSFVPLGPTTAENRITVIVDGNCYASGSAYYAGTGGSTVVGGWHLQSDMIYGSYAEAAYAAAPYEGAFPAYLSEGWAFRVGQYTSRESAEAGLLNWQGWDAVHVVEPSRTGVMVTATGSDRILFYFDCGGLYSLAIEPVSVGGKAVTWFRGYRYYGGFEYQRVTGGNINVLNVLHVDDYVKGCVGWEIGNDKPLEAVKAQAVCARTYAAMQTRHRSQGFDVCTSDDCQVYQGLASANEITEQAVDETSGMFMTYNGKYAEAYYYSSNGGASEDAKNVWSTDVPYLKGKEDPYEAAVASRVSQYNWTATFTAAQIQAKLAARNISVGTVRKVYVSQFTPTGNVYALTFEGSSGSKTVTKENCRTILGLRSMRFHTPNDTASRPVSGVSAPADTPVFCVNDVSDARDTTAGLYTVSGSGAVSPLVTGASETWIISGSGKSRLQGAASPAPAPAASGAGGFTFTGSGWGHNVGMSQWGACAMAEQGLSYRDILQFYYTGVTIG